ncbi:MAG: hypothetical protein M3P51_18325 [Chloroflexota bacterium]|nr:hypothetical protein [Chloroflexota bacterium]
MQSVGDAAKSTELTQVDVAPDSPDELRISEGDTLRLSRLVGPLLIANEYDIPGREPPERRLFYLQDSLRVRVSAPGGPQPLLLLQYYRKSEEYCKRNAVVLATPEGRERYRVALASVIWPSAWITHLGDIRIGGLRLAHVGTDQCSGNAGYWDDDLYAMSSAGDLVRVPIELEEDPRLLAKFSSRVGSLRGGADFRGSRPGFVFCGVTGWPEAEGLIRGTLKLEGAFKAQPGGGRTPRFRLVADSVWRDDDFESGCGSPRRPG